ncbi:ABC transporter permease subunit [Chloroflexi bacterium TSY]|nr:ABC transporter permease subunit [Chloroflexi bacterium TSY]
MLRLRLFEKLRVPLMLLLAFAVLILLFGGGMVVGVGQSFGYFPVIGLTDFTIQHYVDALTDRNFVQSLWLTFRIAFWSTFLSCVLAVAFALVLRESFRGSQFTTFLFQVPLPIPHLVAANGIVLLVTQSGLLARFGVAAGLIERPADFPIMVFDRAGIAIILTFLWKEVPFIGLVVLAILQSVGPQFEEIAQTLGANRWQRFWNVLLPLIMPGILSTSIIVFAFVFASYEIPLLLGVRFPTTLPVLAFQHYQDPDLALRPQAMAISVILAIIAVALLAAYRRLARYAVTG